MKAAIYSRKSKFTGKGESVENQVQMCKEYGKALGVTEYLIYEDEGFSGGNIDRPEFQKMLQDAKKKKFDVLICYRLDRVSRNIADFSTLIEDLQKLGVGFVSIREQFDTSTPMGRAMMYIASVFAQLERETIAERIKDNMMELSKTGRWLGGVPLLGFEVERIEEDGKEVSYLIPKDDEMEIVKLIYEKYLEFGSQYKVLKYLYENNIGYEYRKWAIDRIRLVLRGPYYVITNDNVKKYCESKGITVVGNMNGNGMVPYNQKSGTNNYKPMDEWIYAVSRHKGIIPAETWLKIQDMMDRAKDKDTFKRGFSQYSFLTGLLKCKCGTSLSVKLGVTRKKGEYIQYYTCKNKGTLGTCNSKNVRQEVIDNGVIDYLTNLSTDRDFLEAELNVTKSNKINKKDDEVKKIKKAISKNDTAIQNLVKQMALLSPEASGYIITEVERLSKDTVGLKEKLFRLENEQDQKDLKELNKQIFYEQIKNFKTAFEQCKTTDERRFLINSIVKRIVYDSETQDVAVELLNG